MIPQDRMEENLIGTSISTTTTTYHHHYPAPSPTLTEQEVGEERNEKEPQKLSHTLIQAHLVHDQ